MTMKRIALVFCTIVPLVKAATEFTIDPDGVTCSGDFEVSDFNVECDEYCSWGSKIDVSGSLSITNSLPSDTCTATVRAASAITVYSGTVDFCSSLESSDGSSSCPSAGYYTINNVEFTLPGDGNSFYSSHGYWGVSLPLSVAFNFNGQTTYCSTGVTLSRNNGYTMVYAGALAMAGVLGIGYTMRRRRRVATIQVTVEEESMSHFEMMKDGSVQV